MILNATFFNTQHYKVRIRDKVEQTREKEWRPPLRFGVVAIEKGTFELLST